ncbi:MAG: tRNA lysidine(34) synthetase TilS [Alphaproteobacteria bacterium]|nr:tRNA lysidine(34) synthetase TilS [Alphaproteobacteria bacterium]
MPGRGGEGDDAIGDSDAAPALTAAAFAGLMQPFAPFEPKPVLAVAVSGGPDSLCLCLLAHDWARARGGRVEALTVDHKLRPESTAEARQVGRWLKRRGIAHRILAWRDPKPATGIAAAARAARYRLIVDWAAARGVLHLLLAHHRDDQAETVLLRLGRGSGVDGLAAMAPQVELAELRVLRPFLAVPKRRLEATLAALKQPWVEDPGNRAGSSARSRVRLAAAALARDGIAPGRLAETAARLGRARAALESATATLLARAVLAHPAGFLRLDPRPLAAAPAELRLRALARCLMAVSGEVYPPRLERLERLEQAMFGGAPARGHTLHGCRLVFLRGAWLVCREPAAVAGPAKLAPGRPVLWDGRFHIRANRGRGLSVAALGAARWPDLRAAALAAGVPRLAALTLPAIADRRGVLSVPALSWYRGREGGLGPARADRIVNHSALFMPRAPLAPMAFAVAPPQVRTI